MTMFKTRSRRMYKEPGVIALFIYGFRFALHHGRAYTADAMICLFEDELNGVDSNGNHLTARFVAEALGCTIGMIFARTA